MMSVERDRARDHEQGTTLVELLVALTVFGVIGAIVMAGILSAFDSSRTTNARIEAIQEIESAQRRIAQDLRSATGLIIHEDDGDFHNDITVEFRRSGGPDEARYRIDDSVTPPRLIREGTDQTLVTLLDNQEVELFTYIDSRGNEIDCENLNGRACLGAARVRITIIRDLPEGPPVRSQTEVTIRNVRFLGA